MDFNIGQWAVAFVGAFLIGLSKTGIQGLGVFAVALFALVVPPRESVGLVLPILIAADIVAVTSYHRHSMWSHLWGLLPWAGIGIGLGYLALGRVNNQQASVLIGAILIALAALRVWRLRSPSNSAELRVWRGTSRGAARPSGWLHPDGACILLRSLQHILPALAASPLPNGPAGSAGQSGGPG